MQCQHWCSRTVFAAVLLTAALSARAQNYVYDIDNSAVAGQPVEQPHPLFPDGDIRSGQEGWVRLHFVISPEGRALDPIVIDSIGGAEFEGSARAILADWVFEAPSETAILTATIAVLQDMEFNVDRIEKPLGVITASKVSDADDAGEKRGLFFLDLLCAAGGGNDCNNMSTAKDEQHILLTMVVLPSLERSGEFSVRVTMQRVIFDKEDRVKILERITTPEIYQEVLDNLRQALFIEVSES